MTFVVARTGSGRPSLQHFTEDHEVAICGLDMTAWSRHYTRYGFKEILCKNCARKLAKTK